MDNIIFENKSNLNLKTYSEAVACYNRLKPTRQAKTILLALVLVAYSIMLSFIFNNPWLLAGLIAFLAIVIVVLRKLRINEKRALKQFLYTNPSGDTQAYFNESNFVLVSDNSTSTFDYSIVTHIGESKNLFVLALRNNIVVLDKDGFSKGNCEDFREFISLECIHAKIKLKS